MKKYLLTSLAVFITWTVLDFVIHGVILKSAYEATASLWRPMDEMKMIAMHLANAVAALTFTAIYVNMIRGKSVQEGLKYGLLMGIGVGFVMGFGTYSYMPIPYSLAWGWFIGIVVEAIAAGAVVGAIAKGDS
jgi:hypothetical protein